MPLPKPARRTQHHHRVVNCVGFLRADGLWDIEGRMTDTKAYDVDNEERDGYVAGGEAFHDISLRLTIDQDFLVHGVESVIDAAPARMCAGIAGVFKQLEGTRIGPGWLRQTRELVGGVKGCTHLNELLQPLATTAIQTLWPVNNAADSSERRGGLINSCHTWAQNSEVVKRALPEFYTPDPPST
ncbi:DUF2889 domain-containing protein [Marinobacterium sedimentorum]|uniref:DUF2889 domain-containing protein n=1 Tax=Marinobacterium sedimentorum TaxID=2927804 RepID=UPI0020C64C19|nr:DUF2889 domain-containing protein [Marinobacterium sedimentorum]MCP8690084.1 DUF2889 domain-containing protein [Marinobacterium sedimentorum]